MHISSKTNSVIVIGAGLAGLTAADQIIKHNPTVKVTVLEAMSEPGGRTKSIKINGAVFDLGAQWIGHPQKYVIQLAQRANSETIQQYHHGTNLLKFGNQVQQYKTNIPKNVGYLPLLHMQLIMWKIDRLAKTVPLQNPRDCPNSIQWDSMTAHTWIQQNVCFDKVRRLLELSVRSIIGCELNQVSFLFLLWYIHHNHGLDCLVNVENGLQCTKFIKGTQYLSYYLAGQIKKKGAQIFYNSYVSKVVQQYSQVKVYTKDGIQYKASYLVMAAPPPAIKRINFQPQLSRERRFICERYIMGAYTKAILLYDKQYWRQKGCSGAILSDCHTGPVLMTYDDTRPKQNGEVQPAIVVFMAASIDEQWTRDKQNCKKAIIEELASYFKCPQMLTPKAIQIKVWNQQPSLGGAPTAFTPPGVLTKINNIRQPQGRIHWAGTQTATISQGYMDGAIQSGIRVSKQILRRFSNIEQKVQKKIVPPTAKWYSQITTFKRPFWFSKYIWY